MKSRLFWIFQFGLAAASIALLWFSDVALGIPGEWTWDRFEVNGYAATVAGWTTIAVAIVFYVGFVWLIANRISTMPAWKTGGWLIGLVAVSFVWLWVLQENANEFRLAKAPFVLFDSRSSGYFKEAQIEIQDTKQFLKDYQKRIEGDVLHIGTHPPGLLLAYRGLARLCQASPALQDLLLATEPNSVSDAFDIISQTSGRLLTPIDRATIWLATLITQLAVAATVIPLFLLLRRHTSRQVSWLAVSFWALLPTLAVFLPKSDALFPFILTSLVLIWMSAMQRGSLWQGGIVGLLVWIGMMLSLAVLPGVVLLVLLAVWEYCSSPDRTTLKRILPAAFSAALGFVLLTILFQVVFDLNMCRVWMQNYNNHAAFYEQYQRTFWKWLLVNPLEFAIAVGLPVVVLVVAVSWKRIQHRTSNRDIQLGPLIACGLVWFLLWISGKNTGEAARLWIVLTPGLIWLLGSFDANASNSPTTDRVAKKWILVMALQAVVCAATVARVDGFHFTSLKSSALTIPVDNNESSQ